MKNKFYEDYFQIIEDSFGRYFESGNPMESVNSLLKQPMTSRMLYETSETFTDEINELFKKYETKNLMDLESLKGIKSNFCGSVSPQDVEKFLCQTGLYVDTTVISDPVTFVSTLKPVMNKPAFTELLFRHAFKMLKLKNALINDSEIPILRIIQSPSFSEEYRGTYEEADKQTLDFFNELFDEDFETLDESQKNILAIKTTDELVTKIVNRDLLIPEIKNSSDIVNGFENFQKLFLEKYKPSITKFSTTPSSYYEFNIGSFRSSLVNFNFSKKFRLINSFDSQNSWHNYRWMLENQTKGVDKQTMVINSLTLDKIKWLGNLKLDDIVRERENLCMQDFRDLINKEINFSNDDMDLTDVVNQINYNLETEFKKHQMELKKIEKSYFGGYCASFSGVIAGSISLMSGIINHDNANTLLGGLSLGSSLLGWFKTIAGYREERNKIISSPVGLFFNAQR